MKSERRYILALSLPIATMMVVTRPIASAQAQPPVTVEQGVAQLFVDDYLIESSSSLKRTLRQPIKDNGGEYPMIEARPETTLLAYGSIVRDVRLDRYVMFVQEFPSRDMYRCLSRDGLTWEKIDGGILQRITFEIDVEPEPGFEHRAGIDLFSCYYDIRDKDHPYKGWLFLANYGLKREGIYYVYSADGITWHTGRPVVDAYAGEGDESRRRLVQNGHVLYGPGDVTLFYHDEREERFLGIFKFLQDKADVPDNHLRSRTYAFLDRLDQPFDISRLDHVELLPPAAEVDGNRKYDQYYASTAWRYESLWLGGLKVWHAKEDYPYSAAGSAFMKLIVSRDGLHWNRVRLKNDDGLPEVFIPNGPEGGNGGRNDGGYISEFSQGPLRVGDELIYYYSASSYGKSAPGGKRITGGGVFRARLPIDGFVSVDSGTLTTRPLRFTGDDLTLNGSGPILVELLDASESVVKRAEVAGAGVAVPVDFAEQPLSAVASDGFLRLRFTVRPDGRLYSFTIH